MEVTTPTTELLDSIKKAKARIDVVAPYRDAIRLSNAGVVIDWTAANTAIIDRWSKAALMWIKRRAWGVE